MCWAWPSERLLPVWAHHTRALIILDLFLFELSGAFGGLLCTVQLVAWSYSKGSHAIHNRLHPRSFQYAKAQNKEAAALHAGRAFMKRVMQFYFVLFFIY